MLRCSRSLLVTIARGGCLVLLLSGPATARAELGNFELGGRIYTKFLYQNDDSQGVLTLGNPHPNGDNFSGHNGIGTEGELTVVGHVSPLVSGGMRLQSRFGSTWHDWWENGNQTDKAALTGETLGMDHAQYIKLRGPWMRVGTRTDALRWIHLGASDLSMFNHWTIGKIRYIDRDNASGIFAEGSFSDEGQLSYNLGVIALPKLFVGPGWSTGLDDAEVEKPLLNKDFAYGLTLRASWLPVDWPVGWSTTWVVTFTDDLEVDMADPDAEGSQTGRCLDELDNPIPGCEKDHAVSLVPRYRNLVLTEENRWDLGDVLSLEHLSAYSLTRINPDAAANGVQRNAGIFPVVFRDTGSTGLADMALRSRLELPDIGGSGLGLRFEYFNIGEDFNTIFGARREADVLLTDGIVASDQLPTLNLANEFIDFDEPWAESCIGWHGATALLEGEAWIFFYGLEGTAIGYNTNSQGRDVETIYPDFLHNQGYTDTDLYDYANRFDRGSDPRAVYHEDQQRLTMLGVARLGIALPVGAGWSINLKGKLIRDSDERKLRKKQADGRWLDFPDDDYQGTISQGRLSLTMPLTRWLTLTPGVQVERWSEQNRSGNPNQGYIPYETAKEKVFVGARVEYAGVVFSYYLEYLHKEQQRDRDDELQDPRDQMEDQLWHVIRSKGTAEVAW
ncbi:MAG: hypothetical protein FJ125_08685 [Deltaproteobacteria bacterium]|nr:hypothetical protein [Deltaproteobacteria bacterium]